MERIRRFVAARKGEWTSLSREERICALLLVSVFMPFAITCCMILFTTVDAMLHPASRRKVFHAPGMRLYIPLVAALLLPPILHLPLLTCNNTDPIFFFLMQLGGGIAVSIILLLSVYLGTVMTRRFFELLLDWAVMLSFPCSLIAYIEAIFSWNSPYLIRSKSVFFNANYYGCMIEFIMLICVYKLLQYPKGARLWMFRLAIPANLMGLYLSNSFSAAAAISVAVLFLLFLHQKYKACMYWAGGVSMAAAASFFTSWFLPRAARIPDTVDRRMEIWCGAFRSFLEHPILGQGIFTYFRYDIPPKYEKFPQLHSHNIPLDLLLCMGVVGTALLMAFFIVRYRKSAMSALPGTEHSSIQYLFWATLVSIAVHGITDFTVLWVQTSVFAFVLLSGRLCHDEQPLNQTTNRIQVSCQPSENATSM